MSRLDRHVTMVQSKLTFERFLGTFGYSIVVFFAVVLLALLVDRLLLWAPPRAMIWFWSALGVSVLTAFAIAMFHKPTAHQAAVFIDDKLGLNEKFSTALFARQQRSGTDRFAIAAIQDAERTADNVSLHKRFPVRFPRSGYFAILAAVFALGAFCLPQFDLFDRQTKLAVAKTQSVERIAAQHEAQKVLTAVSALPKAMQSQQKVELAKKDLKRALEQNLADPTELKMTAQHAQEEAEQAKMEEMKANQSFAQDLADKAVFNSLTPSADDHSPVADASREIASGNFAKAANTIKSMSEKFNDMSDADKKKAAEQMKDMAAQLSKIASDPAAMQKFQQQLQQHGASQQQAQQIAQAAQQAAQGNPQAQQQLAQMQQQMMQQMNNGKGPTQQQQSAIAKAMQQMQSVAGSQASAQQMSAAAQQMAQGMQQAQAAQMGQQAGSQQASAKQGGSQPGQQKSAGQQPGGHQQQNGTQQASAQQGGQQQNGASGPQSTPGQQPGGNQPGSQQANGGQSGQGQGQGQQQMKQAGQQMAEALDKMDATKNDAEQQVADNDGGNNGNGEDGQNPGDDGGQGGDKHGKQHGPGMGQGGQGVGGESGQKVTQFTVHQEKDVSQYIANGKILAKTFVKDHPEIGKSTIELSSAAKAAVKESTDDVDGENDVPKDAQKMVRDYFNTMNQSPQ